MAAEAPHVSHGASVDEYVGEAGNNDGPASGPVACPGDRQAIDENGGAGGDQRCKSVAGYRAGMWVGESGDRNHVHARVCKPRMLAHLMLMFCRKLLQFRKERTDIWLGNALSTQQKAPALTSRGFLVLRLNQAYQAP